MTDDDEDWGPGCIGQGAVHDLNATRRRGVKRHPIGFVHFPEKPEARRTRSQKTRPARPAKKAKRRKR